MKLFEELKWVRVQTRLTIEEASKVCGTSEKTYRNWEAGKGGLDVALEGAIARIKRVDGYSDEPVKPHKAAIKQHPKQSSKLVLGSLPIGGTLSGYGAIEY